MNTILGPIDDIVAWVITGLYNLLHPVFGVTGGATWLLTIVLLTVLMRLILVPLFIKQMHTQRAMTALTPQLTEIRKKYKGDREKLNAETMKLYQEAGVNPLMGCLPIVLQMPIFFGLFSVLRYIAEWKGGAALYHLSAATIHSAQTALIFGVSIRDTFLHAASIHVRVVIGIVVATSMLTTYLTMRQNVKRGIMPTGSDNPMAQSQRLMTYILPLFALTGLYWPFGLVLYWVSTNVWTLGQQFVLLRKYPVGAALPKASFPFRGSAGRPATASGLGAGAPGRPKAGSGPPSGTRRPKAGSGPTSGTGRSKAGSGPTSQTGGRSSEPRPKPADAATDAVSDKAGVSDAVGGSGDVSGEPSVGPQADAGGRVEPGVKDRRPRSAAAGSGAKSPGSGASPAARGRAPGSPAPAPGAGARSDRSRPAGSGGSAGSANGHKPAGDGGVLRRFGRGRAEPEAPAPAEPEVKFVRQQRQRQSRSKRSGKR